MIRKSALGLVVCLCLWASPLYAAIERIDWSLVEAARDLYASGTKAFWHVTLPALQPVMMILIVLRFGTSMAVIDEYLIFGGFNRDSPTYTWTIFMYDQAFKLGLWRQGFAAAALVLDPVGELEP